MRLIQIRPHIATQALSDKQLAITKKRVIFGAFDLSFPMEVWDTERMSTQTNSPERDRIALNAGEVSELLGISERHLWALNSSGRLIRPVALGRSKRWNAAELQAWMDAGAPSREEWEGRRRK